MNENFNSKKSLSLKKQSLNTRASLQPPKSVAVISHNRRSADDYTGNANSCPIDTKLMQPKKSSQKYAAPELNSALYLKKRLDALTSATNEKLTDFNQMTPRTKAIATEKVCIGSWKRMDTKNNCIHSIFNWFYCLSLFCSHWKNWISIPISRCTNNWYRWMWTIQYWMWNHRRWSGIRNQKIASRRSKIQNQNLVIIWNQCRDWNTVSPWTTMMIAISIRPRLTGLQTINLSECTNSMNSTHVQSVSISIARPIRVTSIHRKKNDRHTLYQIVLFFDHEMILSVFKNVTN